MAIVLLPADILEKAAGMPVGAVRYYANGEVFRKIGGPKGWQYVGKRGGRQAQAAEAEAKAKGLPVITPSQGKQRPGAGGGQGGKGKLEAWQKESPSGFHRELAHKIHEAHPHPMFGSADIRAKLQAERPSVKVRLAVEHKLEAPKKEPKPAGWVQMSYAEKAKVDKKAFIVEIMAGRRRHHAGDDEGLRKRYAAMGEKELVERAQRYIGEDVGHKRHEVHKAEELKKEEEHLKVLMSGVKDYVHEVPEGRLVKGTPTHSQALGAGGHINKVEVVDLLSPSGQAKKAMWKPRVGERDEDLRQGNVPKKSQWKRERLAYFVNAVVELDNVPPVVVRDMKGQVGVMMDFVEGQVWGDAGQHFKDVPLVEWQKLALHDWLICNTDRHAGNWMVTPDHKLMAIDNGLAFPEKAQWGGYRGYRSDPHQKLDNEGGNVGKDYLALPADLVGKLTDERKKKCVDELERFGISDRGRQIFAKRWDWVVKHKALPPYGGGMFMDKPAMAPSLGE